MRTIKAVSLKGWCEMQNLIGGENLSGDLVSELREIDLMDDIILLDEINNHYEDGKNWMYDCGGIYENESGNVRYFPVYVDNGETAEEVELWDPSRKIWRVAAIPALT